MLRRLNSHQIAEFPYKFNKYISDLFGLVQYMLARGGKYIINRIL